MVNKIVLFCPKAAKKAPKVIITANPKFNMINRTIQLNQECIVTGISIKKILKSNTDRTVRRKKQKITLAKNS